MSTEEQKTSKELLPKYTYYYGMSREEVRELGKWSVKYYFRQRISLGKKLLRKLLEKSFMEQDTARINDVAKAIKFNQELLYELDDKWQLGQNC